MTAKPSDAAIAQAFREMDTCGQHSAAECEAYAKLFNRARELSASAPARELDLSTKPENLDTLAEHVHGIDNSDGWRGIDSAPRDGTLVLLRIQYSDIPVVGEFSHGRWWASTEHHEVSCGTYCYGGSVSTEKGMTPIAWQPLPAAPANGGG